MLNLATASHSFGIQTLTVKASMPLKEKKALNITTCQEQPTSQDAAAAHSYEGAGVKPDQASKVLTLGCDLLTIPSPQASLQIPSGLFLAAHSFWHYSTQ